MPLSPAKTRMLLALRINVLAKGHSGIRVETVQRMLAALNANCLSLVPCKGTVGASGDLAPLSHLALGLMGEGMMWNPKTKSYAEAREVLRQHGLHPITLQAKEGLALINGTQLITSIGSEAVSRARSVARTADVVAALTMEALKASARPFHPAIHASRPHRGQTRGQKNAADEKLYLAGRLFADADLFVVLSHLIRFPGQELVAGRLRNLLCFGGQWHEECALARASTHASSAVVLLTSNLMFPVLGEASEITQSHKGCGRVQDAYTQRCIPQVHGIVHDTVAFAYGILSTECNSATDNPMIFPDLSIIDSFAHPTEEEKADEKNARIGSIISGGNFHGEYPGR